jgi:hypothetical protein
MGEPFSKKNTLRRCLGMNLKAKPFICYVKFFFQLVDKTLADITERSDIVRKYADRNAHIYSPAEK